MLYGSLRERSFSRFVIDESQRLLRGMGAKTRIYDPRGLPQVYDASPDRPKVEELRDSSLGLKTEPAAVALKAWLLLRGA